MLEPGPNALALTSAGMAEAADFFLRTPTLTASNFAALWPTDPKLLALKDLNLFSKCKKFQNGGSILKLSFALSKWPHFHRAYVVTVCNLIFITVNRSIQKKTFRKLFTFFFTISTLSAAVAVAEGEKSLDMAVDLRPSVDPCYKDTGEVKPKMSMFIRLGRWSVRY